MAIGSTTATMTATSAISSVAPSVVRKRSFTTTPSTIPSTIATKQSNRGGEDNSRKMLQSRRGNVEQQQLDQDVICLDG